MFHLVDPLTLVNPDRANEVTLAIHWITDEPIDIQSLKKVASQRMKRNPTRQM
jgi:hypothetical protein